MKAGIVTYGAYVPSSRISAEDIAGTWGEDGAAISRGLNVRQKSVPMPDEDTITISVEAARNALRRRPVDPAGIGAVFVGSESPPYAVKPSATVLAAAIGATPEMTAADLEFACKAGTAGMQAALGMVESDIVRMGLVVGADTSQGRPGDALEYTASAGGAAFILGKENSIARFNGLFSYTTDTPDFWRRDLQPYPSHGGRFTGQPAYFKHVTSASKALMERMGTVPGDYRFAVFHQPNGKFPLRVAKILGFSEKQVETGLLVPFIGNTYSGSTLLGLTAILDAAAPGDRIFACSYGSGAGSDAFDITVTDAKADLLDAPTTQEIIGGGRRLSYAVYAKYRRKIRM